MKKEALMAFIDANIPDGANVEMTIADVNDNYMANSDQPVINEYEGAYELVLELPDLYEIEVLRCTK